MDPTKRDPVRKAPKRPKAPSRFVGMPGEIHVIKRPARRAEIEAQSNDSDAIWISEADIMAALIEEVDAENLSNQLDKPAFTKGVKK